MDPACRIFVFIFYIEYKCCSKQNNHSMKWGQEVPLRYVNKNFVTKQTAILIVMFVHALIFAKFP